MLFYKLLLLILVCPSVPAEYSYDTFVKHFEKQFARDAWMRPSDSLYYLPSVKWYKKSWATYDKLSIKERRQQFFYLFSRHRLRLAYYTAYDLKRETEYYNLSTDWLDNIRRRYSMDEYIDAKTVSVINPLLLQRCRAIIRYIKKTNPDYLFDIETIYTDNYLFWAIRDGGLYAVEYIIPEDTCVEYDAVEFLKNIADDSVFDPLGFLVKDYL